MKIAVISEDGVTISQHFGRAPYYVVLTIEDGQAVSRETRSKMGHAQFSNEPHDDHPQEADPRGHGFGQAAQDRHVLMAQAIKDCEYLLVRGMGAGAYQSMLQAGIQPIVTDVPTIEEATQQLIAGKITHFMERLH